MSLRLVLVRHAPTEETRDARFGEDSPPSARGLEQAATLAAALPGADRASRSPAPIARVTAEALGLVAEPDPALADWDFGVWRGRTLDEILAEEPKAVRAWMSEPGAAPHGGERLLDVLERGSDWLSDLAATDAAAPEPGLTTLVVVTHAAVVRAAVIDALGAPPAAFWALDVAPLGVTELHHRDGRWRVSSVNREPGRGR